MVVAGTISLVNDEHQGSERVTVLVSYDFSVGKVVLIILSEGFQGNSNQQESENTEYA